jgi:hypothetical protein
MASSQDFSQAASVHGLKPRFLPSCNYSWTQAKISSKPKFFSSCKSSWAQAKISSKLHFFMASRQDFLQAVTFHGLKPKFPQSCNYS